MAYETSLQNVTDDVTQRTSLRAVNWWSLVSPTPPGCLLGLMCGAGLGLADLYEGAY